MHYQFHKDLKSAKQVERDFAEHIIEKLQVTNLEFNNDFKYDLRFETPKGVFTVEIKHDIRSSSTGNAAVEYECRGKLSGISTTEADFWVYKFGSEYYGIKVAELKKLIEAKIYFRKVVGGDF